uniref:Uncharacterized protein n=1 Tax=Fagus sylvatica TaxID=28930 RepID=A0A2N9H499_FAGSY
MGGPKGILDGGDSEGSGGQWRGALSVATAQHQIRLGLARQQLNKFGGEEL